MLMKADSERGHHKHKDHMQQNDKNSMNPGMNPW